MTNLSKLRSPKGERLMYSEQVERGRKAGWHAGCPLPFLDSHFTQCPALLPKGNSQAPSGLSQWEASAREYRERGQSPLLLSPCKLNPHATAIFTAAELHWSWAPLILALDPPALGIHISDY